MIYVIGHLPLGRSVFLSVFSSFCKSLIMSHSINLKSVLSSLKPSEWKNFSKYKVLSLRCLSNVEVNPDFLNAAIRFWDSVNRVFWFSSFEICPLFEEFAAIMDTPCVPTDSLALLNPVSSFPTDLSYLFYRLRDVCSMLVVDDHIQIGPSLSILSKK